MQRLLSKRAQLIGAFISVIVWLILILGLLAAVLTNQFPTVAGKIIGSILIIYGIFVLARSARSYWKNRGKDEHEAYIEEDASVRGQEKGVIS